MSNAAAVTHTATPPRGLRPEIQALRAVAVSLVAVYHFWPAVLPGGFVGVDVFFAISGFLITTHLLRELDRTGGISLGAFWARRARRILPPALIVLLSSALATIAFVPLDHWQQFLAEVQASTAYGQNWHLAAGAVDYFSADDGPSPVEHFWSLSAEEQFYIGWPLLLLGAATTARIRHLPAGRTSIALMMSTLIALSLAYGIHTTAADPATAYFITPTRAWEFGAGGLLALLPQTGGVPQFARGALAWLGLAAIFVAAFAYTDATPFPGYAALLPVLGCLLVIRAGAPNGRWAPTRLLTPSPVQFVGDISYSIYLWHWPLLVLAPFAVGRPVETPDRLVLLAVSVLAAWLSKLVIEDPVRAASFLTRRRARWTFASAAAATAVVMSVTLWGGAHVEAQIRKDAQATQRLLASNPACFGAAARDPERPCNNPDLRLTVVPTPVEARGRPNAPCTLLPRQPINVCAFGVPAGRASDTIALVGDSHASHWRAALDGVARTRGWRGLSITRSGCPLSRTVKKLRNPLLAQCVRWNQDVPRWFAMHPEVSTVFVVQASGSKWVVPRGRSPFETEVAGFERAWIALPRSVKHIVVIRDTPKDKPDTLDCVGRAIAERRPAGEACAVPRRLAVQRDSQAVAASRLRSPRVRAVDLTRFFCDRRRCFPVIGGALVHKDDHHLTAVFAATLGPYLLREVDRLAASWTG